MRVHFVHWNVLDTVVILEEGNPPPPTVRLMRHAGTQAGPEREAPGHGTVCKGGGAEEMTDCGGGDEGEFGAGF